MSFFSQIFKSKKTENILALDIGTEVVKALVFQIEAGMSDGVVIGAGKVQQDLGNMHSGAVSDISGVIATSRESIRIAKEKAGIKKIKNAIVGIAGELVKGTTTTVHYQRINPEKRIEMGELKKILEVVQRKAYERIKKQISWETGQEDLEIKMINAAVVDIRIDGYQINNPLGFQGRDVSVSVFNAYAPMIHLGALQTIARELGIDLLSIAAEPYAVAKSMDTNGDNMDFSAIFIDIGGGTTDIAVVRNGGLEGTKIFALGGRAFTKKLSQELGISFGEAESLKIKYSEGKLGSDVCVKVEKILKDDCEIWLSGVELALMEFADIDFLPSRILLCGGGSGLPGIKEVLSSSEWTKNVPFSKAPTISFLQPRDVVRVIDGTGELKSPQDVTPMSLANLALDLADNEKTLANILRRAMHSIKN